MSFTLLSPHYPLLLPVPISHLPSLLSIIPSMMLSPKNTRNEYYPQGKPLFLLNELRNHHYLFPLPQQSSRYSKRKFSDRLADRDRNANANSRQEASKKQLAGENRKLQRLNSENIEVGLGDLRKGGYSEMMEKWGSKQENLKRIDKQRAGHKRQANPNEEYFGKGRMEDQAKNKHSTSKAALNIKRSLSDIKTRGVAKSHNPSTFKNKHKALPRQFMLPPIKTTLTLKNRLQQKTPSEGIILPLTIPSWSTPQQNAPTHRAVTERRHHTQLQRRSQSTRLLGRLEARLFPITTKTQESRVSVPKCDFDQSFEQVRMLQSIQQSSRRLQTERMQLACSLLDIQYSNLLFPNSRVSTQS